MWIEVLNTIVVDGRMFTLGETRDVEKSFLKKHGHEVKPTVGKKKSVPKNRVIYRQTVAPWDRQKIVDPVAETKKELESALRSLELTQGLVRDLRSQAAAAESAILALQPVVDRKVEAVAALEKKLAELQPQAEENIPDETGNEAEIEPATEDAANTEGQTDAAGQGQPVQDEVTAAKPKKATKKKSTKKNSRKRRTRSR